jgi:hypothetical protein
MAKDPRMQAIFKTFYYLDSTQPTSALWHTIPVYDNDTKPNLILPSVQVPLIMLNSQHNTKVSVLQSHPMTEAHNRIKNKAKVVLICSGSSMVPGGCSDQGIETNETALYLASSYSLFINQLTDAYPLELNNLVVIPHVLVFKNPCSQDFAGTTQACQEGIRNYFHLYNYDSKFFGRYGCAATEACFKPRITVQDNWGWCTNNTWGPVGTNCPATTAPFTSAEVIYGGGGPNDVIKIKAPTN